MSRFFSWLVTKQNGSYSPTVSSDCRIYINISHDKDFWSLQRVSLLLHKLVAAVFAIWRNLIDLGRREPECKKSDHLDPVVWPSVLTQWFVLQDSCATPSDSHSMVTCQVARRFKPVKVATFELCLLLARIVFELWIAWMHGQNNMSRDNVIRSGEKRETMCTPWCTHVHTSFFICLPSFDQTSWPWRHTMHPSTWLWQSIFVFLRVGCRCLQVPNIDSQGCFAWSILKLQLRFNMTRSTNIQHVISQQVLRVGLSMPYSRGHCVTTWLCKYLKRIPWISKLLKTATQNEFRRYP